MIKKIFGICLISFLLFSCGKDKFNTKPSLTFKEVNARTIPRNTNLKFTLNVTDKEGDLSDSIFIFKINRNCNSPKDTLKLFYKFPTFPTTSNLEVPIEVNFSYVSGPYPALTLSNQCVNRNDSCKFRFVVRDKAKNVSDTVESPEVVLLRN